MSEWKTFLYFLALTTFDWLQFTTLRTAQYEERPPYLSSFDAWFAFGITILGLVFLFACNGGPQGRDFLYRYFPLSVVVGWKFVAVALVASWVGSIALQNSPDSVRGWASSAILVAINVAMFLRIGFHLNHLARQHEADA